MNEYQHGEVHCMLCGRCVADIELRTDGRMYLSSPRNTPEARVQVSLHSGRLHCARCGGRAFVEWDLISTGRGGTLGTAA